MNIKNLNKCLKENPNVIIDPMGDVEVLNKIRRAITSSPEIIEIGSASTLSKRKAHKLATHYRGSRRAIRYLQYLAGNKVGFLVNNNRLTRMPMSGAARFVTFHAMPDIEMDPKI